MRKQLALGLGLAVMAAPAFASKARLQALGEDIYGSYYIQDSRNVFLNASEVNNNKDLVTFEWGNSGKGNTTAATHQDTATTPKAEGGVFFGHGNMVYGVYLGKESNQGAAMRSMAGVDSEYTQESNAVDLFVAGDAGIKWGANLHYSKSAKNEIAGDAKQDAMSVQFGVSQAAWTAFANISLANKAETAGGAQEFKGGTGIQLGGSYKLNDYTLFAEHKMIKGSDEVNDTDVDVSTTSIGAGRTEKLNDKASLFTKASYAMSKCSNETALTSATLGCIASGDADTKINSLPVVIGLEYDAASWLTLRGSISQTIMGSMEVDGDKKALDNTTAVNTGATLKFGDFNVDGVIGNNTAAGSSSDGVFNTQNLMSRVSFTYKF